VLALLPLLSVSDLPLCIIVTFHSLLLQHIVTSTVLSPHCRYSFIYNSSGDVAFHHGVDSIKRVNLSWSNWCLVIDFDKQKRRILWRGQCSEREYRHFIVEEKRRRLASVKSTVVV
jgi:hypothetical protein